MEVNQKQVLPISTHMSYSLVGDTDTNKWVCTVLKEKAGWGPAQLGSGKASEGISRQGLWSTGTASW